MRRPKAALSVVLLLHSALGASLSPKDIPDGTPLSSLLDSAKASLAQGNSHDALAFYDAAISRDPTNFLTIFQRGATYLSLGRDALANDDFDKVLTIKPDFEGALLQRARLKARNADWRGAKADFEKASKEDQSELQEVIEAEKASDAAQAAEAAQDWESCVTHAGTAILVASKVLSLRQTRAKCRFERGEIQEGISDLQHVMQLSAGSTDPYLRISASLFYSLGDADKGLAQIKKCLHSDPDSKPCSKLYRRERRDKKQLDRLTALQEKRQYNSAVKVLVGEGEDTGLIEDVKTAMKELKEDGIIPSKAPDALSGTLVEMACEFYTEMNSKKRAEPFCEETLAINPNSLHGLLHKARKQLDKEEYEPAINTLNEAKENHPGADQIQSLLQKAHTLLKRSKTKDYYKILEVDREADERTIKRAYRTLTKKYHPDKAHAQGLSKEDSEKKMAAINEAWEVLNDPEKKAMFDRGVDPNSQEQQGAPFQGSPFGGGGQQFFFHSGGGGGGGGGGRQQFQFQGFPGGFPGGGGGGGGGFPGGFPFG